MKSTLRKLLPADGNLKKSRKLTLHPIGNTWRTGLGRQKYADGVTPWAKCFKKSTPNINGFHIFTAHEIKKIN